MQSMTREEYRAWVERQPVGSFERIDGVVVAIAPERVEHNDRKMLAWLALRRAIRDADAPCHVQGDGMTVEVGDSDYEPDSVVYCGERLAPGSMTVPEPLIVVEVLSPSTSATDRAWKLREYFRLPFATALPDRLGRPPTDRAPSPRRRERDRDVRVDQRRASP